MKLRERVFGALSLTALVGASMLVGWGYLGTDNWWLATPFLLIPPITFLTLTRND